MKIRTDIQATIFHRRRFRRSKLILYMLERGDGTISRGLTLGQAYAIKAGLEVPRRKKDIPIPFVSTMKLRDKSVIGFL